MDEKVVLCANPIDLTREETPEITRETPEITREETPEMPLMEVAMAMKIAAKKEKEVQLHSEQHQEEIHELHTSPKNEVTLPDNRVSTEYDDDGLFDCDDDRSVDDDDNAADKETYGNGGLDSG